MPLERPVKERLIGATILVALIVIFVPALLSGPRAIPSRSGGNDLDAKRRVLIDVQTSKATPSVEPLEPSASAAGASGAASVGSGAATPGAAGSSAAGSGAATGASASPGLASNSRDMSTTLSGAPTLRDTGTTPSTASHRAVSAAAPLEKHSSSPISPVSGEAARDGWGGTQPSAAHGAAPVAAASTEPGGTASGTRPWSVQVGVFANRSNAEKLVHQLKSKGASAYLLTVGSSAKPRYRVRVGPLPDRAAAERTVTHLKAEGHSATLVAPGAVG
jgi:DedD protein